MGHVGGLYDVHDLCWQFSGRTSQVSSADLLSLYRDSDAVNAPPGSAWLYSNGGYLMLTAAIERIAECSLEEFLRERVFEPVGMWHTVLRRFDNDFVPNSASLHRAKADPTYSLGRRENCAAVGRLREGACHDGVGRRGRHRFHNRRSVALACAHGLPGDRQRRDVEGDPDAAGSRERHVHGLRAGPDARLTIEAWRRCTTLAVSLAEMPPSEGPCGRPRYRNPAQSGRRDGVLLVNKILDACFPDAARSRRPLSIRSSRGRIALRVVAGSCNSSRKTISRWHPSTAWIMPVAYDDHGVLRPSGIFTYLQQSITLLGDSAQPDAVRFGDFGSVDELVRALDRSTLSDRLHLEGIYRSECDRHRCGDCARRRSSAAPRPSGGSARAFRLEPLGAGLWRARSTDPSMSGPGVCWRSTRRRHFRFSASRTWGVSFRRCAHDGVAIPSYLLLLLLLILAFNYVDRLALGLALQGLEARPRVE